MDCKFCNLENTNYSCILCGNCVCNVCAVPVDESQEGYDEQNYQLGNVLILLMNERQDYLVKDKIKEKDVVTQCIKRRGRIFESFLIHGMFRF